MSQITDDAGDVIAHYYGLFKARYHGQWKPSGEHLRETIDLFRSDVPGIPGYTKQDLIARLNAFFRSNEDWVVSTKHSYSVFIKHIHRWIEKPAHPFVAASAPRQTVTLHRCDCGRTIKDGEFCADCFPVCSKCGSQHAINEGCDDYKERIMRIQKLFSGDEKKHVNKTVRIGGESAFDEKKKFIEKDGKMMRAE